MGFIAECHTPSVYGAKMLLWVPSSGSSRLESWANKRRLVQRKSMPDIWGGRHFHLMRQARGQRRAWHG